MEQYGHLKVGDSSKIFEIGGTRKTYFPPLVEDTYSIRGRPEKVAESFKSDFATVEKLCLVPCDGLDISDLGTTFLRSCPVGTGSGRTTGFSPTCSLGSLMAEG